LVVSPGIAHLEHVLFSKGAPVAHSCIEQVLMLEKKEHKG